MAPSTASRMTFHRQLASVDLNTNTSHKPFEAYSLLRQVKLKQKRLISNQFCKPTDLHDDKYSGFSKGYPSTDVTGVPSESNQGKSSSTQSPSLNRKNRKSNPQIQLVHRQSKHHIEIPQKASPKDPLGPIRSHIDPEFSLEDKFELNEDIGIKSTAKEPEILFESLLNLSLSMINREAEIDKPKEDFGETSATMQVSLHSDQPNPCVDEDFGLMEDPEIPEEFQKVEVSMINPTAEVSCDAQFDSMEAVILAELGLNLSLSLIQPEEGLNEFSQLSIVNAFDTPIIELSAIENGNMMEDCSAFEVIVNALLLNDFPLDVDLSTVKRNEVVNRSDLEVLEALNILEA